MAQAILADSFPPQKRGMAFALYGITTILAPTIGPTLGGWITDNYTWRWIFYINLPVGILAMFLVYRMVEDPPYLRLARGAGVRLDYMGIALLALGVGALQVVLDKGQEDDWFGSHFILTLAVVAGVCLVSLVIWEWFQSAPIVDVRLFRSFNFAVANLMMFVLGVLLFSSLVMMPQFLQTLMGYTAQTAGLVLSASGVVLFFEMPIVGQLTSRYPAKYIIAFGWLALAGGMYLSTKRLDLLISFRSAAWLRVAQAAGMGFLFVPITLAGYIGIPSEKSNSVAGIINFMRNIGSSVGTSMVTTLLARRAQFHQTVLSLSHPRATTRHFATRWPGLHTAARLTRRHSARRARPGSGPRVPKHASSGRQPLSYLDTFMVLAIGAGIMFVLAFIIRRNNTAEGGEVAVG